MNIKNIIENIINFRTNQKDFISQFLKKNYSIIIIIFTGIIVSHLIYLFLRYNYLVINQRFEPQTEEIKLEENLLNQVIEKIKEKSNIEKSSSFNAKNPFLP